MNAKVIYCRAIQNNILVKAKNCQSADEERPPEETEHISETLMDTGSHRASFSFLPTGLRSRKAVCSTPSFFCLLYSQPSLKLFLISTCAEQIRIENGDKQQRTLLSNEHHLAGKLSCSWLSFQVIVGQQAE